MQVELIDEIPSPYAPPHDKTNKMTRAPIELRSAWASAQSDQSLHCLHEEVLGPWLSIKRTKKTGRTQRLI